MYQMWGDDDSNSNKSKDATLTLPGYDFDLNRNKSSASNAISPITLPDLTNVDLGQMPMMAQQKPTMTFANELTNRCGISYFSGLVSSGFYGAFRGWRLSQSGIPMRLRLNSLLNHAMKLGAHNGNMFAILSMYFVCSKRLIPKLTPFDMPSNLTLILSGASAGVVYKSMHPFSVITKWGLVGATLPACYVVMEYFKDEGYM
mmetsp:Transcript_58046/g.96252  ORF Transcript_58046/g.96252 Transcript_58046/m.96252 type:complete len:202 (+) Transcript_58046:131-736(+)|eukprot:CAMPEP_0202702192 /NCGR_PEP_ID=MMETSP1385-20130828/15226_1 /ASSEMBLY_ACC=CAM_ASM_000861 /TAXON_ID=933848 /ORGANISM="Elphidium margaritaceum" /LENGTH=201 /DNA_ID=CAMNT_0049359801 /DNA_START=126 /DNA_END=734 /DNA_ORIENTATION=-